MSDQECDIHDVTRSAVDLVALGCTLGAMHLYDSTAQLQFSSVVSSYANEIIRAVDEGIISAWEGVQEIRAEYAELTFYVQNTIVVAAGAMQVEAGIMVTGNTRGVGAPYGFMLVSHGVNNIVEGAGNIKNGPDAPSTVGPVRKVYQYATGDVYQGDMAYYSADLFLSGLGMARKVRKPDSVQLFRSDPKNYQRAYQQFNKIALFFEALVDSITIGSMLSEEKIKSDDEASK